MFLYFRSPVILLVESQTRRPTNKSENLGSSYINITVTVPIKDLGFLYITAKAKIVFSLIFVAL